VESAGYARLHLSADCTGQGKPVQIAIAGRRKGKWPRLACVIGTDQAGAQIWRTVWVICPSIREIGFIVAGLFRRGQPTKATSGYCGLQAYLQSDQDPTGNGLIARAACRCGLSLREKRATPCGLKAKWLRRPLPRTVGGPSPSRTRRGTGAVAQRAGSPRSGPRRRPSRAGSRIAPAAADLAGRNITEKTC